MSFHLEVECDSERFGVINRSVINGSERSRLLLLLFTNQHMLVVKGHQLVDKVRIRLCTIPFFSHVLYRPIEIPPILSHQVRTHHSSRSRNPRVTMDQNVVAL